MDDMMNKIGEILSDPESIKQITELAQMFMSEAGNSSENNNDTPVNQENQVCTDNAQSSDNGLFSGFDLSSLLKIQEVMGAVSGKDKNAELLLALKPHLSPEKQKKTDKAIKLLKLLTIWTLLKDSGILKDLFNNF
ncbi:MAG: hypothetical protein K2G63_05710 [Oscillospiraceae bacterium]|nr:hypothetical protein [Oscillospiraceae bacterium]